MTSQKDYLLSIDEQQVDNIEWLKQPSDLIKIGEIIGYYYIDEEKYPIYSDVDGILLNIFDSIKDGNIATCRGCKHEEEFQSLCLQCNIDLSEQKHLNSKNPIWNKRSVVQSVHGVSSLKVSRDIAVKLHKESTKRLIEKKKLSLVLDLDHTLLHASVDEVYSNLPDIHKITVSNRIHFIKFRPHLIQFLKEISKLYELHIYTHGIREYAEKIAKLLDPNREMFYDRIVSRDEYPDLTSKTLNDIFPSTDDQMVVIIDDRADVWLDHLSNWLPITPFHYFMNIREVNNPTMSIIPGKSGNMRKQPFVQQQSLVQQQPQQPRVHSIDQDIQLEFLKNLLIDVHKTFFQNYPNVKLVNVIQSKTRNLFKGCHFVFSGVIPTNYKNVEEHLAWRLAKEFGATCHTRVDEDIITHIIASRDGTSKVNEGREIPGCFITHVQWLYDSIYSYKKCNELDYLLHDQLLYPIHIHYSACKENLLKFQKEGQKLMNQLRNAYSIFNELDEFIEEEFEKKDSSEIESDVIEKELEDALDELMEEELGDAIEEE